MLLSAVSLSACVADDFKLPELDMFKAKPAVSQHGETVVSYEHKDQADAYGQAVPDQYTIDTEALLENHGPMVLVEQGRDYDPAQAHLEARKKVNTKRFKNSKELAAHFEPNAQSGKDEKYRVLRVKGDFDDVDLRDYESGGNMVVKPAYSIGEDGKKVAYTSSNSQGNIVISSATPIYTGRAVSELDSVRPPPLPERKKVRASVGQDEREVKVSEVSDEVIVIPKRKPRNLGALKLEKTQEMILTQKKLQQVPVKKSDVIEKGEVSAQPVFINNIRSGDYSGNARLVIEISQQTKYKATVDTLRNVLRVRVYNARLSMDEMGVLSGTGLMGSYVAQSQQDGTVLIEVRLKQSAEIVHTIQLPPHNSSNHRLVIDLQN